MSIAGGAGGSTSGRAAKVGKTAAVPSPVDGVPGADDGDDAASDDDDGESFDDDINTSHPDADAADDNDTVVEMDGDDVSASAGVVGGGTSEAVSTGRQKPNESTLAAGWNYSSLELEREDSSSPHPLVVDWKLFFTLCIMHVLKNLRSNIYASRHFGLGSSNPARQMSLYYPVQVLYVCFFPGAANWYCVFFLRHVRP